MEITLTQKETLRLSTKNCQITMNPSADDKAAISLFTSRTKTTSEKNGKVFMGPGEYEVQGCMVDGIPLEGDNTAYGVFVEGIHVFYAQKVTKTLTDAEIERIDGVDILILNVEEDKAELMNGIISQIEPRVVLPLNENEAELKILAAEFGAEIKPVEKYKISKKDLPEDSQQLIILKAS